MNSNIRIAVQIAKLKDPTGREILKATVPLSVAFLPGFDTNFLEEHRERLERDYLTLVAALSEATKGIKAEVGNGGALAYWHLGDILFAFEERNREGPLVVDRLLKDLVRDVGISAKMLGRCKRFRRLFPNIEDVDPKRSFDSYVKAFEGSYISKRKRMRKQRAASK